MVSILREHCRVEGPIEPESRLREELGLDSLGILTLMVELEEALQKPLPDPNGEIPETVGQLAEYLETHEDLS